MSTAFKQYSILTEITDESPSYTFTNENSRPFEIQLSVFNNEDAEQAVNFKIEIGGVEKTVSSNVPIPVGDMAIFTDNYMVLGAGAKITVELASGTKCGVWIESYQKVF